MKTESPVPGLHGTAEEHLALLERAADAGIVRVFTSLHIPEADTAALRRELRALLQTARRRGLDVVADVSPQTAAILGVDSLPAAAAAGTGHHDSPPGLRLRRAKDGLIQPHHVHPAQRLDGTARVFRRPARSRRGCFPHRLPAQFLSPASYGTERSLFYRPDGVAPAGRPVCRGLHSSQHGRRGPLFEGLPTLEDHRRLDVSLTARHLAALGVQSAFIGDGQPSDAELEALAAAGREEKGVVVLKARLCSREPWVRDFLSYTFTSRLDPSRDMIRTQESRSHASGSIVRDESLPRRGLRRGDVTIDTDMYLRYRGEMAIMTADAEEDDKTMIAAQILPEERFC